MTHLLYYVHDMARRVGRGFVVRDLPWKEKVGRPDIDSFESVMTREDPKKGFFVAFDFSADALTEIDSFFRHSGKVIIPLTVTDILEEQLAKKLA